MVGMTLKVEAQELILDTQEDVQEPTVYVPFYILYLDFWFQLYKLHYIETVSQYLCRKGKFNLLDESCDLA